MKRSWRWYAVRAELAIGVAAGVLYAIVATTATQPMFGARTAWAVYALGGVAIAVGLAWMWRIYRDDPEPGAPPWRYRDRR